jgi:triosephosphate isomerase (TIM)
MFRLRRRAEHWSVTSKISPEPYLSRWYNARMTTANKKFMIVGNWKMNPETLEEAKDLFSALSKKAAKSKKIYVMIAPPTPFLDALASKKSTIIVGAQDVARESKGAFTGSVSAHELKSAGAEFAIIGHSERRAEGDTDEIVAKKVGQAIDAGLKVILCVGEKERDDQAKYLRVVRDQILTVFASIKDKKKLSSVTIAYEPVWKIGAQTAMIPSEVHEMSIYIKKVVGEALGNKAGLKTSVLYGGAVDSENDHAILTEGSVDGLLIGRQSLNAESFGTILAYANSI